MSGGGLIISVKVTYYSEKSGERLSEENQFSVLIFAGGSLEEAGARLAEEEEDKSTSSSSS